MSATIITSHKCAGCDKFYADRHLYPVKVWDDTFYACETCVSELEGPGRAEGVGEDDRPFAVVLEALAGISMEDEFLADEWNGYAVVFGRYILTRDDRGFIDVREYRDHDAAIRELRSFEDDGMGAQEDDAWISYETNGVHVSFAGKSLGTFKTLRRAQAAVSVAMRREGYFPNVWLTGEHGPTIRRIDVW